MKRVKKWYETLGPGFVTGASDDDPSGIATYSQTGAIFGYLQLWTALFTFPFMLVVQELCGRIGMVTGKGLAGVIRTNYSKKVLYASVFILLIANTVNIGANLGAMASSIELLIPLPFAFLLICVTVATLLVQVLIPYKVYASVLKYLAFSLLAYVITFFVVDQNWAEILRYTLVPQIQFSKEYFMNIVAILGTTISPYLFFWQASEEVEEEIDHGKLKEMGHGKPNVYKSDLKRLRTDTAWGMFFSNIVMFFIIATSASTLNANGITHIATASEAASALQPLAGNFAFLLFALGIVGTGLLAVPVLAGSASYAVSEAFGWKEGLYKKFSQAKGFYGVIIVATIIGMLINFTAIDPFSFLYYTAVLNGICAPVLLIIIMKISNNSKIMGSYVVSKKYNIAGWAITALMGICGIVLIGSFIFN